MATYTNKGAGPRGINLKDGRTAYLEVGEAAEFDDKEVKAVHPDIVKAGDTPAKQTPKSKDTKD